MNHLFTYFYETDKFESRETSLKKVLKKSVKDSLNVVSRKNSKFELKSLKLTKNTRLLSCKHNVVSINTLMAT